MKKSAVVGIVVALLAIAYPALTWWTGKQAEDRLAEHYKMLEGVPFVKVVKRDFQRGFSSSQETVTFEIFGDMFRSIEKAQKESLENNPDAQQEQAAAAPQGRPRCTFSSSFEKSYNYSTIVDAAISIHHNLTKKDVADRPARGLNLLSQKM